MPDSPNPSALCLPCGLCCDGTLFERASLRPGEEQSAASLGLEVIEAGSETPGFRQPCPAFNGQCGVYRDRPRVCRGFHCKLLLRYARQETSLTKALEQIARARALRAELTALLARTPEKMLSLAEVKRQLRALSTPEERGARLAFVVLAAKYEMYLRSHFILQPRAKDPAKDTPVMR
jgi:hypothetical protein